MLFQPTPCGYLFRHQPANFQKGPVKAVAPCPLPTGVIKPGNQPVVCCLWVSDPQVGLSPTHTPVYRNLPFQPVPNGTSLGGRKIKERILGQSYFQALHDMRFEIYYSQKSSIRERLLDQDLQSVKGASPCSACHLPM